ncbi:hypothetical protein L210DRAFT_994990 [Boletus edulis BED1]|uniref:Uncharacterized protein n=1 Tax=Boletus edulis BED1 TaxID=1328754 RepID=A0AAD4BGK6_BOLED|nr:hypothetical protein L210DRAFT_994990 [Boletus edulis BED1]
MPCYRDLHLSFAILVILATALLLVGPAVAQFTNAICLSSFDWMTNSKGQNPCLVSAYLVGACVAGGCIVDALHHPHDRYLGPTADEQNPCQCSSVTYNTTSACALCQNGTVVNWSRWSLNCSTLHPGVFSPGVPGGTAVPQWAFQDVTTSDRFSLKLAEVVGDTPESTATQAQSTGSLSLTSTVALLSLMTQTQPATLTPAPVSSPASLMTQTQSAAMLTLTPVASTASSGGSKTETIVMSVAGGIVGVTLPVIAGVTYYIVNKRRSRIPPEPLPPSPNAVYTSGAPFGLLDASGA